ncbi:MAG: hypothetical protein ACI9SE_003107 [Neolewinella sp.]|jgi:hypothetical protein
MRNQLARVTLGAFFGVASAVAQEPATSTGSLQLGASTAASELSSGQSSFGMSGGGSSHFEDTLTLRYSERLPQQDDNRYTLDQLFRQHHGEFLDRFERYDPALELRARLLPKQRVSDEPGSFDMLGYDFDVEAAMVITTEAYLKFGIYHYGRHYNTTAPFGSRNNPGINSESNFGDETLTAAGARVGLGWFLTPNLLMELETNPGIYSDLEDSPNHKDFDFPSSALFTYRPVDNFFFKFGARYNQVFEDAPWLPYLGFSWEIVDGLRLDLLAPEYIELSFWPTTSTSFAFGAEVGGAEYRVRSTSSTGKQAADVRVQEVIAYIGMTHRFNDYLSLQARGGLVLAGEYELSSGASNFDPVEGALDQGFYADFTFGLDW